MDPDKTYQHWKRMRRDAPVPDDFSERVMEAIQHSIDQGEPALFHGLMDELQIPAPWPARLVFFGGLITLGLFRFVFIAKNLVLP